MLLGLVFLAQNVFAASTEVTVNFEIVEVNASCKSTCMVDEVTAENKCRYQVFFDQASFDQINALKTQFGYRDTWFQQSPKEICEAKLLPEFGQGNAPIKVMLYNLDLSNLNRQF